MPKNNCGEGSASRSLSGGRPFHWQAPVSSAAEIPSAEDMKDGYALITLNDNRIWAVVNGAWTNDLEKIRAWKHADQEKA